MKKMLICAALLALVSSAMAGGELPTRSGKQYYAQREEVNYVMPPPVQEKPGFLSRVGGYFKNRAYDVGDALCSTVDAVVGIVTLDPEKDDK